jgi:hypothetical protein
LPWTVISEGEGCLDPLEHLEELRRQQALKSPRRRPGSMQVGSGNASLYIAVLVLFVIRSRR